MSDKPLTDTEITALTYLRNQLVHGISPSVRDLMRVLSFKSPNSTNALLKRLMERGRLRRRLDGRLQLIEDLETSPQHARTVLVPLVGAVPCGTPMLADENLEAMVPVSQTLAKPGHRYFLLRARGSSMNAAGIDEGDLLLVRQQNTAKNGDRVVALIDDEATVKEFWATKDGIVLKPRSKSKKHQPIILHRDFDVQGVVVHSIKAGGHAMASGS